MTSGGLLMFKFVCARCMNINDESVLRPERGKIFDSIFGDIRCLYAALSRFVAGLVHQMQT